MKRQHPRPAMELPISLELHSKLGGACCDSGFEKEDWEIAAIAIREWLARNNPNAFHMPAISGFQWKHLFLPNGTVLRTIFNGKNYHCRVDDDHILYNGQMTSPNGFVNTVGGVRRNAWKVIWILFPNSETWKLAASLRSKKGRDVQAGQRR
jgi:hypothetical protein